MSAEKEFIEAIQRTFASYYSQMHSERVKRGIAKKRESVVINKRNLRCKAL